jgi:hypothetical protein
MNNQDDSKYGDWESDPYRQVGIQLYSRETGSLVGSGDLYLSPAVNGFFHDPWDEKEYIKNNLIVNNNAVEYYLDPPTRRIYAAYTPPKLDVFYTFHQLIKDPTTERGYRLAIFLTHQLGVPPIVLGRLLKIREFECVLSLPKPDNVYPGYRHRWGKEGVDTAKTPYFQIHTDDKVRSDKFPSLVY